MNTHVVALLIALALLVTVPVGCRVLGLETPHRVGRAVALVALALPTGPIAGVLAAGWLATSAWLLWQQRHAALTTLVALAWVPAAAAWLACDRFGIRPLDFDSSIVLLTAAHFHHAGFGVSALLARTHAHAGLWLHQAGMVTVAAGITFSDALEPIGATLVVCALIWWTVTALRIRPLLTGWRRAAVTVSAVAWMYPMLLAVRWAIAPLGWPALTPFTRALDAMVAQHGAVNAIALVLLGLLALMPASLHATHTQEVSHADTASS